MLSAALWSRCNSQPQYLEAAKETVEGVLEAVQHVLKYLGMDALEMGPGLFELRQGGTLTDKGQRFTTLNVSRLALGKGVIVEAPAGFQRRSK